MDGGSWHCTGGSDQDQLQEKQKQKDKMAVWGGLTNSWEKREVKGKGEKERYIASVIWKINKYRLKKLRFLGYFVNATKSNWNLFSIEKIISHE